MMQCSKDHFTYDALDGKVRDESDGVVDGDIYYYDMIFLNWISKNKKKALHVAHGSFLSIHQGFMEIYHTTMER